MQKILPKWQNFAKSGHTGNESTNAEQTNGLDRQLPVAKVLLHEDRGKPDRQTGTSLRLFNGKGDGGAVAADVFVVLVPERKVVVKTT